MHDNDHWGIFFPMFWGLFALTIIIVKSVIRHRARMRAFDVTRQLAEKGIAVPAEVADALRPPTRGERQCSPQRDLRLGVILLAVAASMVILGLVLQYNHMGPDAMRIHPVIGAAAFPALIGLAMLGLWASNPRRNDP